MIAVSAGSLEPGTESIRKSLLEPDAISGISQRLFRHIRRPEVEDALLLGGQLVTPTARQRIQDRLVVLPPRLGSPISFTSAHAGRYVEMLIDNSEIATVVQNALIACVVGKYCDPEADVRLEFSRPWKVTGVCGQRGGSQHQEKGNISGNGGHSVNSEILLRFSWPTYRSFKRHFNAGTSAVQSLETPLVHLSAPVGGYPSAAAIAAPPAT